MGVFDKYKPLSSSTLKLMQEWSEYYRHHDFWGCDNINKEDREENSMKWKILDKERADQYKLELLEVGSNTLLEINLKYIPKGMNIEDYVKWIQKEGIVLK